MNVDVVILAAGKGTRMRSLQAKVLQPLAGRPMLAHVIASAHALTQRVCVVYGYAGEQVRAAFPDVALQWACQEPQLGTGHAVMQALPHLSEHGVALILYGDTPLVGVATLKRLQAIAEEDALALLTVTVNDPSGYGRIVRAENGDVLRIVEHKEANADERAIREINTGIMAMPIPRLREWLGRLGNHNEQGEYYLTDLAELAVADGMRVISAQPDTDWEPLGVNDKQQLAELERIYQRNVAHRLMAQGVTLIDPARLDVRGELVCGRDVEIDVNCVFEGRVVLGDGVRVAANCVLRNATVGAGTRVAPFSHIDQATISSDCIIGPYARLRPGSQLGEGVHVGNFVEIKNSRLGADAKASHLSYIGDADVGQRVNIGAGTITCNYDGVNKYRTVIEDDVFIGSDTQLVAPVRVGRGATLGAGTTLTKDAPADQLTVSRARQVSLPGWKRPVKK